MPIDQLFHTSCPRGKGLDPSATGYQIKACSDGITDEERRLLHGVCMHYGNAVYTHAPRAALDAEREWFKPAGFRPLPEQVLSKFPVVWTYDAFSGGRFALTRVCYLGLNPPPDGRPGNFFAHSLVFTPDALGSDDGNPLSLERVPGLFQKRSDEQATNLEALSSFGVAVPDKADYPFLRDHAQHIPNLVTALIAASLPNARPVLICLADWRSSAGVVEALLNLLPPSARVRTTFCTYETERKKPGPSDSTRPASVVGLHHLIVQCNADRQSFGLRPDEVQSAFVVFNFVENQFSPVESPSHYATFASECVSRNNLDRLRRHHSLVENLGLGQDRNAWNSLVAAADISLVTQRPDELVGAVRALVGVAVNPAQAEIVLERLLPIVARLAEANNSTALESIAENIATFIERASSTAKSEQSTHMESLRTQARKALHIGRGRTVVALLKACGHQARRSVLISLLTDAVTPVDAKFTVPAEHTERGALLDLLIEGIPLVSSPPQETALLLAAFRAAQEAGLSRRLWERVGATVTTRLVAPWDEPKTQLLQQLTERIAVQDCADGFVALRLKRLEAKRLQDEQLIEEFKNIAKACPACLEPRQAAMQVLQCARMALPTSSSPDSLVTALGHMAEAMSDPACHEIVRAAYVADLKLVSLSGQARIRKRLAGSGVVSVLARDLLDNMHKNESTEISNDWADLLKACPKVLTKVCLDVAALLKPASENSLFPLAEQLVKKFKPHFSPEGAEALFTAIVLSLPLKPLTNPWETHLGSLEQARVGAGFSRLCVIKLMGQVEQKKLQPDWSIEQFPVKDEAWENHLARLSVPEKKQAVDWAIDLFRNVGIRSSGETESLAALLAPAKQDSPQNIAAAIHRLVEDRDAVTIVAAATHVADCALKSGKRAGIWRDTFKELTRNITKSVSLLLVEHLVLRQGHQPNDYRERVDELCEGAELPAVRPQPTPPSPPLSSNRDDRGEAQQGSGIKGIAKHIFGMFRRDTEAPRPKGKGR